jgi:hypothetical protein
MLLTVDEEDFIIVEDADKTAGRRLIVDVGCWMLGSVRISVRAKSP